MPPTPSSSWPACRQCGSALTAADTPLAGVAARRILCAPCRVALDVSYPVVILDGDDGPPMPDVEAAAATNTGEGVVE